CSNVAALILTRALSLRRELAVRTALGATRWRLVGQMCAEGGLLATAGGVVGVALSVGMTALASPLLGGLPRLGNVHLDGWALLIAVGTTVVTAAAFGGLPAWWLGRS